MIRLFFLLLPVALGACAGGSSIQSYRAYLEKKGAVTSEAGSVAHCRGYGCKYVDAVALDEHEWAEISKNFQPSAGTPSEEREDIALAIGNIERIVGAKAGTDEDVYGTFRMLGDYQLDCVDESTNTTTYLAALLERGLLRFHEIEAPNVRLPLIHAGRWPHQTAVIRERESGERYAVDSWFRDNGADADVVHLKAWKDGWKPDRDG